MTAGSSLLQSSPAQDVGRYPRVVVGGTILHPGDNLDPSRRYIRAESIDLGYLDLHIEGNVAGDGLGNLKSHPMERRMPRMAKDVEVEIR
jgi:hypothetical protein